MKKDLIYIDYSIKHILNKCTKKYKLPDTVAELMLSKLLEKLELGKDVIKDSLTYNGIKYEYTYNATIDRYSSLELKTESTDREIIVNYQISFIGDYIGSTLHHFYFISQEKAPIEKEASMNLSTNILPCENADNEGIDTNILLRRMDLLGKMFDTKNDKTLPIALKKLQDEFIRDNLINNGVFNLNENRSDVRISEYGSTILDDVYEYKIWNEKIGIIISIDKEFKAHFSIDSSKKNDLKLGDIPDNIRLIVFDKIDIAKKNRC